MAKKKEIQEENTIIDKEKIEKEIIKDVKDKLLDDLSKQVEVEVQGKLDKMEKKIYKQKQRTILKKNIIIILLLALVIFEGKILYDNGLLDKNKILNNKENITENKNNNNESSEQINKEENNKIEKDNKWYIENYSYLKDKIKTNLTNEDKYYLYKDNYTIDKIKNTVKLNIAYQLLNEEDIEENDGFITIEASKLKEAYNKIFTTTDYENENFSNSCIQFLYNESLDKYLAIKTKCNDNEEIKEEIIEITEKDNKIMITTIMGIYNKETKTLKDINNKEITKKYNNDLLNYKKSLNIYKYTFINKDKEYYLESINKLK